MNLLRPVPLAMTIIIAGGILFFIIIRTEGISVSEKKAILAEQSGDEWTAPEIGTLPNNADGDLIRYGRELIARTSFYLGPKGTIAPISNGMNCQNCHLDAGTKNWGNNYSAVASTYPRFRYRSGSVEDLCKRINDCMERSLNAKQKIDSGSSEMKAMVAYISWLGKDVKKNTRPAGMGIMDLKFLQRAADTVKGRNIYALHCKRCHGESGEGSITADSTGYIYPPLWGEHSYTTAAGMYRLSRLAGFIRMNMPDDAPERSVFLTDEEAWDAAAYINSRMRPLKVFKNDWPDISGKPIDHPFGPYADSFSETQHKYGPFTPIQLSKVKTKMVKQ